LRVGDSLQIPYLLLGALPGGSYALALRGDQATGDAHMVASLSYRPRSGTAQLLAQAEGTAGQGVDGGMSGDLDLTLVGNAVPSVCGDNLVPDLTFRSGSSPYLELNVELTTP
jgi:hypothetical protein